MIKINWSQIKNLKSLLLRQGYTDESDVMVMIMYRHHMESQRTSVKLAKLDQLLFDIESNPRVVGIYLFDSEFKKPLWRMREMNHQDLLENTPLSGHPSVLKEFTNMVPEQRDVWVEIALAQASKYLTTHEV
jgi:hypothetical protein